MAAVIGPFFNALSIRSSHDVSGERRGKGKGKKWTFFNWEEDGNGSDRKSVITGLISREMSKGFSLLLVLLWRRKTLDQRDTHIFHDSSLRNWSRVFASSSFYPARCKISPFHLPPPTLINSHYLRQQRVSLRLRLMVAKLHSFLRFSS